MPADGLLAVLLLCKTELGLLDVVANGVLEVLLFCEIGLLTDLLLCKTGLGLVDVTTADGILPDLWFCERDVSLGVVVADGVLMDLLFCKTGTDLVDVLANGLLTDLFKTTGCGFLGVVVLVVGDKKLGNIFCARDGACLAGDDWGVVD